MARSIISRPHEYDLNDEVQKQHYKNEELPKLKLKAMTKRRKTKEDLGELIGYSIISKLD